MPKTLTIDSPEFETLDSKTKLRVLQMELVRTRKQQAKLTGEISKESLKMALKVDDLVAKLGGHLRTLRLNAGLSQTRVSTALGKRSNVMSRIENNKARLSVERYAKLLAILNQITPALIWGDTKALKNGGR